MSLGLAEVSGRSGPGGRLQPRQRRGAPGGRQPSAGCGALRPLQPGTGAAPEAEETFNRFVLPSLQGHRGRTR